MTAVNVMIKFAVLFVGLAFFSACDIGTAPIEDEPAQQPGSQDEGPDDSESDDQVDPDDEPAFPVATYSVYIQSINQDGSPDPGSYIVRVTYRYDQDPQTTLVRPRQPSSLDVEIKIVTNNQGRFEATFVTDEIESPQRSGYRVAEATLSRSHFLRDVAIFSVKSHE